MKCNNINCNNTTELRSRGTEYKKYCSSECRKSCVSTKVVLSKLSNRSADWLGTGKCKNDGCTNETYITTKGKYSLYCSDNCKKAGVLLSLKMSNLKKYGTENVAQSHLVKSKIKLTFEKKYNGHPMYNESIKAKLKNTHIQKDIDKWNYILDTRVGKADSNDVYTRLTDLSIGRTLSEMSTLLDVSPKVMLSGLYKYGVRIFKETRSSFEDDISNLLTDIGIEHIKNTRIVIPPKELDIYIPKYNLAIECNGDYWHSELQGKDKNYHINKTHYCNKNGINLLHIYEHEWQYKTEILKSIILSKLGKLSKIYARKCKIKEVSNKDELKFLNDNHIQGYVPSKICYGLYYKDVLVSVMSFGKSRFTKDNIELLRFSNILNSSIIGGASKLFSHFVKMHNYSSIVSYSHKDKFTGNLYKQLGFKYSHTSLPSYYYTQDYINFENRLKYQKHKLHKLLENFRNDLSEWENMKNNGYDRIWDCGNDVWIWNRN